MSEEPGRILKTEETCFFLKKPTESKQRQRCQSVKLEMACDHHTLQNLEAMCPKQTKTVITTRTWLHTTSQLVNCNPHAISVLCQMYSTRHSYFKLM
jgi:hypothetical protein